MATYIQSGNVVFSAEEPDSKLLAAALEQGIAETLAVAPRVVVLSRDEMAQVVADNPYPGESNPEYLHAVFRSDELGSEEVTAVAVAVQRAKEKGSHDERR